MQFINLDLVKMSMSPSSSATAGALSYRCGNDQQVKYSPRGYRLMEARRKGRIDSSLGTRTVSLEGTESVLQHSEPLRMFHQSLTVELQSIKRDEIS